MKTQRKHGFTIVELVVVIAVVTILAAVLIPTFVSIIKKANDSAYVQERQNQRLDDLAAKLDNDDWLSWEDFEKTLAEELAKSNVETQDAINTALEKYIAAHAQDNTGLTEAQVNAIVARSLEGQITLEQVNALIKQATSGVTGGTGVTTAQVQAIVSQAIAGISPSGVGLTAAQVQSLINSQIGNALNNDVKTLINNALENYKNNQLTAADVQAIVKEALENSVDSSKVYLTTDWATEVVAGIRETIEADVEYDEDPTSEYQLMDNGIYSEGISFYYASQGVNLNGYTELSDSYNSLSDSLTVYFNHRANLESNGTHPITGEKLFDYENSTVVSEVIVILNNGKEYYINVSTDAGIFGYEDTENGFFFEYALYSENNLDNIKFDGYTTYKDLFIKINNAVLTYLNDDFKGAIQAVYYMEQMLDDTEGNDFGGFDVVEEDKERLAAVDSFIAIVGEEGYYRMKYDGNVLVLKDILRSVPTGESLYFVTNLYSYTITTEYGN